MVGTGLVIVIVAINILMRAACIGYFARRPGGFNWLSHLSGRALQAMSRDTRRARGKRAT
jgi:hypothetical protein